MLKQIPTILTCLVLSATVQAQNNTKPKGGKGGKGAGGETVITLGARVAAFTKVSVADLKKHFWLNREVQAFAKGPLKATINYTCCADSANRVIAAAVLDSTSGYYVAADTAGRTVKWLAVRYRGIDVKSKKPIEVNMLKNMETNRTTVWAEDGENNYSLTAAGLKTGIKAAKLGATGTIRFERTTITEQVCLNAPCCRCFGAGCNPCAIESANQIKN